MRQKYVILIDDAQERLKIKEYAIIDKNMRKVAFHMLKKGSFSFLYEETYESDTLLKSMSKGMDALVAILRPPKFSTCAVTRQNPHAKTQRFRV